MQPDTARASFLRPSRPFVFIGAIYALGLVVFVLFRLAFLIAFADRGGTLAWNEVALALLTGWRFDTLIMLAALLPLTVALPWLGMRCRAVRTVTTIYLGVIMSAIVLGLLADLRYYHYFDTHLNFQAMQYLTAGGKTTRHLLWTEQYFWISLIVWAVLSFALVWAVRAIYRKTESRAQRYSWLGQGIWFLLFFALSFLGIRGRTGISPIDWGVAYISQNQFVNQLGLNGVYTFLKALSEEGGDPRLVYTPERFRFPFVPTDNALDTVQTMLGLPNDRWLEPDRSLLRETTNPERHKFQPNIVIVLMESWTGRYTGCLGAPYGLTPRFDSLAAHGILFSDFYATGTRTNYGLAGTLLSYPSLPGRSILDRYNVNHPFVSLPRILKERGYHNVFAYGGDLEFDNMRGFFKTEQVDRFYGEDEFGRENDFAKWGVPDHIVFDKTSDILRTLPRPFMLAILTLSNHEPFDLPDSSVQVYADDSEESRTRNAHRYADFALGRFIDSVSTQPNFDSTIFLFVSDHTRWVPGIPTPHPLQHHIPMLIYSPALLGDSGRVVDAVGGQTDLLPTLMGGLGGQYRHASWGRDLLSLPEHDSGFAVMNVLNRAGIIGDDHFYTEWVGLPPSFYRASELDSLIDGAIDVRLEQLDLFAKLQRRMRIYMQLADQLSLPDQIEKAPQTEAPSITQP